MSIEVSAKAPKINKEATIIVDLGDDLDDAVARFGKEVVFSNYVANVKIVVQGGIRAGLERGLDQNAIQAKYDNYKPGVTMDRTVDPVAALAARLSKLSPEEREAEFERLRQKLAGA